MYQHGIGVHLHVEDHRGRMSCTGLSRPSFWKSAVPMDYRSTAAVYKCCSLGEVPPYWVSFCDRLSIMVLILFHWICLDGILPRCMSCTILTRTTMKVSQCFLLATTPRSATGKQLTTVIFSFLSLEQHLVCLVDAQSYKRLASRVLGLTGWNGTPASCTGVAVGAGTRSTQIDCMTVKRSHASRDEKQETKTTPDSPVCLISH
jgi:hypothetical protein